jgi:hypothetical protein
MSWKLNDQEFQKVIALPPDERYWHFVKRVADWGEIWSLRNADGWVLSGDDDGHETIPVWPHRLYAEAFLEGQWADCEAASIDFEEWMTKWLPGIEEDGRHVAVFPVPKDPELSQTGASMRATAVEPLRLLHDLEEECAKLE